eukprot:TRINITY_DN607_c0_g2_i1.p1 TRINITY_DN607_c0_g2~~TRINITY_DN607_c0_g2_i1.p1  ORF type:complete len:1146 (+),score=363.46 TRINITY_DN607_c0_g2_i1:452-3439(+)
MAAPRRAPQQRRISPPPPQRSRLSLGAASTQPRSPGTRAAPPRRRGCSPRAGATQPPVCSGYSAPATAAARAASPVRPSPIAPPQCSPPRGAASPDSEAERAAVRPGVLQLDGSETAPSPIPAPPPPPVVPSLADGLRQSSATAAALRELGAELAGERERRREAERQAAELRRREAEPPAPAPPGRSYADAATQAAGGPSAEELRNLRVSEAAARAALLRCQRDCDERCDEQHRAAEAERRMLRGELEEEEARRRAAEAQGAAAAAALSAAEGERAAAQAEAAAARAELQREHEAAAAGRQAAAHEAAERQEQLEAQRRALHSDAGRQLAAAEEEIAGLQGALDCERRQTAELRADASAARARVADAERAAEQRATELHDAQERQRSLAAERDVMRRERDAARGEAAAAQRATSSARRELESARADAECAGDEAAAAQRQCAALREEAAAAQRECAALRAHAGAEQQELREEAEELAHQNGVLLERLESFRAECAALRDESELAAGEFAEQQQQLNRRCDQAARERDSAIADVRASAADARAAAEGLAALGERVRETWAVAAGSAPGSAGSLTPADALDSLRSVAAEAQRLRRWAVDVGRWCGLIVPTCEEELEAARRAAGRLPEDSAASSRAPLPGSGPEEAADWPRAKRLVRQLLRSHVRLREGAEADAAAGGSRSPRPRPSLSLRRDGQYPGSRSPVRDSRRIRSPPRAPTPRGSEPRGSVQRAQRLLPPRCSSACGSPPPRDPAEASGRAASLRRSRSPSAINPLEEVAVISRRSRSPPTSLPSSPRPAAAWDAAPEPAPEHRRPPAHRTAAAGEPPPESSAHEPPRRPPASRPSAAQRPRYSAASLRAGASDSEAAAERERRRDAGMPQRRALAPQPVNRERRPRSGILRKPGATVQVRSPSAEDYLSPATAGQHSMSPATTQSPPQRPAWLGGPQQDASCLSSTAADSWAGDISGVGGGRGPPSPQSPCRRYGGGTGVTTPPRVRGVRK